MKVCVIFDSVFGNTEQIARAVAAALENRGDVEVLRAGSADARQLGRYELLIVGSPTQRFRPIKPVSDLLSGIPAGGLKGVQVAAFDTRLTLAQIQKTPVLLFFVRLFGHSAYAAKPIADALVRKGGQLIAPPEGFFVQDMQGPLVEGELARATRWAEKVGAALKVAA